MNTPIRRPLVPVPLPPRGWPLWRLGFRPFYLGAALLALLAVPAWLLLRASSPPAAPALPPLLWHAHEMLFGFAAAVIIGFLLTAGRVWTGLATPRGASLAALAGLWLAARVAAAAPGVPPALLAALDWPLLPLVGLLLGERLLRAGNHRNLPLVAILLGLAAANGVFHAVALGWLAISPLAPLHAALALVVVIACVIGGRVVPGFTMGALPGLQLRPRGALEAAALACTAAGLAAWVFALQGALSAPLLALAALLQALRQLQWQPWLSWRRPILWILHAGYAWIAVGLALLAAAQLGWVAPTAGVHALAVGAIGGLVMGMITRTARGHTGRPLRATPAEVAAYALVMAAALARTLLPLLWPAGGELWLWAAALAWCAAFTLYLGLYTPWLLSARADGKDG